jgi:hypothetical protein
MTTVLLAHGGSDTVNIGTHAYYRRDDGAFHLDDADAALHRLITCRLSHLLSRLFSRS